MQAGALVVPVSAKTPIHLILFAMFVLMSGCTTGIGGPDNFGILYHDVSHSESRDTIIGGKRGEACQTSLLSLFAVGNNSIPYAANSGAIREVTNVVFRNQGVLFGILWRRNCTIVYGR